MASSTALPRWSAIVFDVDGTLVDSERDGHRVAFNRAFAQAGRAERWSVEEYGDLLAVAGGRRRLMSYLLARGMDAQEAEPLAARLHARKTEVVTEMALAGEIRAREGAAELIEALSGAGVRLAIATTGNGAWVRPLMARLFGPDRFEAIVTADEAPELKPDPSAYRLALARLGLGPERALAIEDSLNGLRAARAAQMACVVVHNSYTEGQPFTEAAAVFAGYRHAGRPDGLDLASLRALQTH